MLLQLRSFPLPMKRQRKLKSLSCCLTLLYLSILCCLISSNQAGVIKKRDTNVTETASGNIVSESSKETEPEATVFRQLLNTSVATLVTKSPTGPTDASLATETSKEFTYNEILLNEAKKLLAEMETTNQATNQSWPAAKKEIEADNTTHDLQDLQQINKNLENKEITTRESNKFSNNDVKEEKTQKFSEIPLENSNAARGKEIFSVSESNLSNKNQNLTLNAKSLNESGGDKTPNLQHNKNDQSNSISPSEFLAELTEQPALTLSTENRPVDHSIGNGQEKLDLKLDNRTLVTSSNLLAELTEQPATTLNTENRPLDNSIEDGKEKVGIKLENKTATILVNEIFHRPLEPTISKDLRHLEDKISAPSADLSKLNLINTNKISTSVTTVTESLEVLNKNSIVPLEHQAKEKENDLTHFKPKTSFSSDATTPESIIKEDLLAFEGDKKEYARSMFMEDITTLKPTAQDEELIELEVTTFKPVKLSIKEGIPEVHKDHNEALNSTNTVLLNIKEKKPKFINDNSTNAQQLNLPNNAEVWSLAAMKSLPKSNVTMDTAQAHNNTLKETKSEQNASTMSLNNNNSEKSLLDWSQIMMDKELSSTTRIGQPQATETTLEGNTVIRKQADQEDNEEQEEEEQEVITMNSLTEQKLLTTSTISPAITTTIPWPSNNKEHHNENLSLTDKKVEENMNNHIETTLTASFASTNVDINPFNTSLNIEPNLNEINLTSNQTKVYLNNYVYTTTAASEHTTSNDVKAAETSTVSAATTTPTTTMSTLSTPATAVYDDVMTTVEQISSETTTVSTLATTKQNVSSNSDAIAEQTQFENKLPNVNKAASHNELDDNLLNKNQLNQYDNSALITKTTTVIPAITTFRPTILAITSTTSQAETFEQEVDQKGNEIQTNLAHTTQQSIIKFDLQQPNNTTTAIVYETTTFDTLTTPSTATEHLTTRTTLAAASKDETSATSFAKDNETTTTTSSAKEVTINETTEHNFNLNEKITTQTTLKQEDNEQTKYIELDKETTTGSAVLRDKKFENKEYQNTTTTAQATTETNLLASVSTTAETPVVFITAKDQQLAENFSPTTQATTTPVFTEQNIITTTITQHLTNNTQENSLREQVEEDVPTAAGPTTKIMNNTQESTTISAITSTTAIKEEETHINVLNETATTTTTTTTTSSTTAASAAIEPHSSTSSTTDASHTPATSIRTTTTTTIATTTTTSSPSPITTKVEEIYNVINSTTTEVIQTTTQQLLTEIAEESTSSATTESSSPTTATIIYLTEMLPPTTTPPPNQMLPTRLPTLTAIMGGNSGNMYTKNSQATGETDVNVIIAITVSVIGVIALILLVGFLYLMRKRQKQTSYSQRCRPVSLDEYTIDNASVGDSMRKSNALRASKRTYGNLAFDDPTLRHNPMGVQELAKFVQEKLRIFEEFRDVPQITSRLDEVPTGCEDKNRYANVLPLPETRVILQRLNDDEKTEYINANYVTGTNDPPNYYIACQAPLESTVEDFWRMIWEQQSRVIIQATDLIENGVEKCAEYLPPSVTLDNHSSFGDFQITLQNREVKDKYAISTLLLKHVGENATRELTHYWYKWPEKGVPAEEAPIIAMLLEARSSLISYAIEQANEDKEKSASVATLKSAEEGTATTNNSTAPQTNNSNANSANSSTSEINGNISMVHIKKAARNQGPLTVHCSPGTGRTGTIIACDIAIRSLETPKRIVDIPQIVYSVRRGRASAVLTKEQYEFIYKVANMYAAKITNPTNYN